MSEAIQAVVESDPITLNSLPSPRRSVEGHYGITDHLDDAANGTNISYPPTVRLARSLSGLRGPAVIDIAEERSVSQESEDFRPGRSARLQHVYHPLTSNRESTKTSIPRPTETESQSPCHLRDQHAKLLVVRWPFYSSCVLIRAFSKRNRHGVSSSCDFSSR
jgi:hypothetical protein